MRVKTNLRIIRKNNAADPEKEFLTKLISKPYGRATAVPSAWELKFKIPFLDRSISQANFIVILIE